MIATFLKLAVRSDQLRVTYKTVVLWVTVDIVELGFASPAQAPEADSVGVALPHAAGMMAVTDSVQHAMLTSGSNLGIRSRCIAMIASSPVIRSSRGAPGARGKSSPASKVRARSGLDDHRGQALVERGESTATRSCTRNPRMHMLLESLVNRSIPCCGQSSPVHARSTGTTNTRQVENLSYG